MALVPRTGTTTVASLINNPQTSVDPSSVLDQTTFVKDTFINRTAINSKTYADEYGLLQGYLYGTRVSVTYFKRANADSRRTDAVDVDELQNTINTSYTQINNLEITMVDPLQSAFNTDTTETEITGEAIMYVGLEPSIADLFVMSIDGNQNGIFQISSVERLTFRQGSNYKITFYNTKYATTENVQLLYNSVSKVTYFEKSTYFGDTSTLLLEDQYIYLKTLVQMRQVLIKNYFTTFYNPFYASIMSPEQVYDPYLVKYLFSKVSVNDSKNRPVQLYPSVRNFDRTIWARLLDPFTANLVGLSSSYDHVGYMPTRLNAALTPLINRTMISIADVLPTASSGAYQPPQVDNYVYPVNPNILLLDGTTTPTSTPYQFDTDLEYIDTQQGYVLSTNFYSGTTSAMSAFELLMYTTITTGTVTDIGSLVNTYVNTYMTLTDDDKYYMIPLYLYLIDIAIKNLRRPGPYMF